MPIEHTRLKRSRLSTEERIEVRTVSDMVRTLRSRLHAAGPAIDAAHVHGASSAEVQKIVSSILTKELRFKEEQVLRVGAGFHTRARPDFVKRLGAGRGVIAEVERGATLNGNFDLKDFWKVHIAPDAHHLILVVPRANWTSGNSVREEPYRHVVHRLSSFFGDSRREVDVVSCHILGYGRATFRRPVSPISTAATDPRGSRGASARRTSRVMSKALVPHP